MDGKCAPEAGALDGFDSAVDGYVVAEFSRPLVIDFGSEDDGEESGFRHFSQGESEFCGEFGSGRLDPAQIGDIVDDASAVGVEEHYFFVGFDGEWHVEMG